MSAWMVGWLILLSNVVLSPDHSREKGEPVTLNGRVVELGAALKSSGVPFDPGPVAGQVVLQAPDGALTPLLSDEASRALFLDRRLRDRPTEIDARRYPGNPYVQVITF